jgi:hypothetical protein
MRDSERFLSLKQELYSRYIALVSDIVMSVVLLTDKEYTNEPDWQQRVPEYTGPVYDEVETIRANIRLIGSPVVFERAEYCNTCILVATSEAMRPDRSSLEKRHAFATRALRARQGLSDAMRADLRGDEETLRRIRDYVSGKQEESDKTSEQANRW